MTAASATGATRSRQRLLAGGLFVALVVVTAGALLWAWQVYEVQQAEISAKAELLDSLKRHTPQRLGQARPGDIDRRDPYLAGESETIAAANMQRRIRGLVETAGGQVFSSQLLMKSEGDTADRRIELQLVFEGRMEAVQAALFEIETGAPFGFVDELAMAPARSEQVGDPAEAGRVLRTTLTVSAYWRKPS